MITVAHILRVSLFWLCTLKLVHMAKGWHLHSRHLKKKGGYYRRHSRFIALKTMGYGTIGTETPGSEKESEPQALKREEIRRYPVLDGQGKA